MNTASQIGSMALALMLCWPAAVVGQGRPNSVLRFDPTSVDVREEGTLICYRCDLASSSESSTRCQQEGHQPLLRRPEGNSYLLIESTNSITTKLNSDELHGKQVRIKGIYYPKTNQMLVEEASSTGQ